MPRKPAAKPASRPSTDEDPNRLVRREAGDYRTPDERFEVRTSGVGWMLLDREAADDFGQPLARGPFPTLDAARETIPEARRATIKPVKRQS